MEILPGLYTIGGCSSPVDRKKVCAKFFPDIPQLFSTQAELHQDPRHHGGDHKEIQSLENEKFKVGMVMRWSLV